MKKSLTALALTTLLAVPAVTLAASKNPLSVHVLNQQTGLPASEVEVMLEQKQGESWEVLNTANTNQQGRIDALWPAKPFEAGDYRVILKPVTILRHINSRVSSPKSRWSSISPIPRPPITFRCC